MDKYQVPMYNIQISVCKQRRSECYAGFFFCVVGMRENITKRESDMSVERKGNLSELAASYLRDQIMTGQLKMKEKIVEKEIAEQLGISRGPIREALMQLQHEGFVDYEPNKGCTVTLLSPKDAYEIFYLRGSMERLALERCGGHLMQDAKLIMEEALENLRICVDDVTSDAVAYDELFHKQIVLSGQMNRLTKMWESLSPLNCAMFMTVRNINQIEVQIREHNHEAAVKRPSIYDMHKQLYDVLVQGDLNASIQAINRHYQSTGERIYRIGMKIKNLSMFQEAAEE